MKTLKSEIKKNERYLAFYSFFLLFTTTFFCYLLSTGIKTTEYLPYIAVFLLLASLIKKQSIILVDICTKYGNTKKIIRYLKLASLFNPFSAEMYNLIGENYALIDNWQKAIHYYRKAIKYNSGFAKAYSNLGMAYQESGDTSEALKSLFKAIESDPLLTDAFSGIGLLYTEIREYTKAFEYLDKGYKLRRGISWNENPEEFFDNSPDKNLITGIHKLKHDIGQLSYLIQQEKLPLTFSQEINKYRKIYKLIKEDYPDKFLVELQSNELRTYDKNIYFEKTFPSDKPLINKEQDIKKIQQDYFSTFSGLVYFDDFLKPETLQVVRSFCLNSTIWHDYNKTRGYIGSYLDDGFYSPLLFQIAEELKIFLPGIFGSLPLTYMWAYKYPEESSGFKVHADRATINVNFWLTPDSANLDPDSGGMKVYEKLPPHGWNFDDYNIKTTTIKSYLAENNSNSLIIPYRQNRVVIFDSRLFHETDNFTFAEGYENMRLNITFLFGNKPDDTGFQNFIQGF